MEKKISKKNWFSNPGNGKAVPQHELDEKTMTIKPKFDKDGKRVVHNLYDDIQKFKDTNSLARILKIANGEDLENLSIICDTEQDAKAKSVDYTKMANAEKIADVQSKLNKAHITADDLIKFITDQVKASKKVSPTPDVKTETKKVVTPEKVENKDEIKK